MDTSSPEFQEIIAVIRREHRRTQMIFGISIVILCLVIMYIAPAVIRTDFSYISNKNVEPAVMQVGTSSATMMDATTFSP